MVAGAGRSGTTWLASIIASQVSWPDEFQPFEPRKVRAFQRYDYFGICGLGIRMIGRWPNCQRGFLAAKHLDTYRDRSQVERIWPQHRLIKEIRETCS